MAARWFYRPFCYRKMATYISGRISLASDASVSASTGVGFTVAKTSTGLYTVTLNDQFFIVDAITANLLEGTPTALFLRIKTNYTSIASGPLGTFQMATVSGTTLTDVSAASEIHFRVDLANTTVTK